MARSREEHNAVRRERLQLKGIVAEDVQYAKTDYLGECEAHCCLCDTPILYNYILLFERPSGEKIIFEPVGSECITDWAEAMPPSLHRDALLNKVKDIKNRLLQEKAQVKAFAFVEENKLLERYAACTLAQKDYTLKNIFAQGWKTLKQAKLFLEKLTQYEAKQAKLAETEKQRAAEATYRYDDPQIVQCSVCSSKMIKRLGPYGWFLGCSRFPKCRHTQNLEENKPTESIENSKEPPVTTSVIAPFAEEDDDLPFELTTTTQTPIQIPICPKCGGTTKFQEKHAFWLCISYPKCKGFIASPEQIQQAKNKKNTK